MHQRGWRSLGASALCVGLVAGCVGAEESSPTTGADASLDSGLASGDGPFDAVREASNEGAAEDADIVDAASEAGPTARSWHALNGACAKWISGADGNTPWAIGCTSCDANGNCPLLSLSSVDLATGQSSWTTLNATGTTVSAGYQPGQAPPNLYVWMTAADGSVYLGAPTSATNIDLVSQAGAGTASLVTCGPQNPRTAAYLLTDNYVSHDGGSQLVGYTFATISAAVSPATISSFDGAGSAFTVGVDGTVWAVGGNAFQWNTSTSSWDQLSPEPVASAKGAISGASSATLYAVTTAGDVGFWSGTGWTSTHFPTMAAQVSVGKNGNVWAVAQGGVIYTYQ